MSVVILRIYSFSKYFEIVLFKLRFYTFESSSYIYLLLILLCWHSKIFQFPNFWLKSCTVIVNHRLRITIWDKQISTSLLNPYWKILENSSRIFSEISVFRGVTQTDFWKTRPVFFRNFNFRGMSWTVFWKIHPSFCWEPSIQIWTSFPEVGNYEIDCRMSSP